MAKKNTNYKFTIKDFCKYVVKHWVILAICVAFGGLLAIYSYAHQSENYSSSATIMVHDNEYEFGGSISPYVQMVSILTSKNAYEDAGVEVDSISFDGLAIKEKATGVFEITDSNLSKENARNDLQLVIANAEKVISKAYDGEKHYRVTILSEPGEPQAEKTKKDKILSSAIILVVSILLAIVIDFVTFNKKAD